MAQHGGRGAGAQGEEEGLEGEVGDVGEVQKRGEDDVGGGQEGDQRRHHRQTDGQATGQGPAPRATRHHLAQRSEEERRRQQAMGGGEGQAPGQPREGEVEQAAAPGQAGGQTHDGGGGRHVEQSRGLVRVQSKKGRDHRGHGQQGPSLRVGEAAGRHERHAHGDGH
ncbi:MAG: hypothetical protein ABIS47_01440, partial [Acidimicrobiales bacterium]